MKLVAGRLVGVLIALIGSLFLVISIPTQNKDLGFFMLMIGIGLAFSGRILTYCFRRTRNLFQQGAGRTIFLEPAQFPIEEAKIVLENVYLEVKSGPLSGKKISLARDDFSIGRGRDNALQLPDLKVSRLHARIRYAQSKWFIQDQYSADGIYVNGKKILAVQVMPGDQIRIGNTVIVFMISDESNRARE